MDFTGYYWVFYWVSLLLFSAKDSVFIGRFLFRFSFVFLFVCFICLFFFAWRFFIGFLSRDGTVFFIRLVGRTPSSCRFFFPAVLLFVFFLLFFIIVFFFVHRMGHHRHVASLERAEPVPANVVCG